MRSRPLRQISLYLTFAVVLSAEPAFDVASIRPHVSAPEGKDGTRMDSKPGSVTMRNVNLRDCIQWAWEVKDYQVAGPEALNTNKYDISAKAGERVSLPEMRQMLQALLQERFHLLLHRETKEMPVYELMVAKSGPKLHKADPGGNTDMRGGNGSFQFRNTSMEQFADDLSGLTAVARPVLDRTGISGNFDFELNFGGAYDMKLTLNGAAGSPSLFTLIQEQLGLQLKTGRGRIEQIVVDAVDKTPAEN